MSRVLTAVAWNLIGRAGSAAAGSGLGTDFGSAGPAGDAEIGGADNALQIGGSARGAFHFNGFPAGFK